MIELATGDRFVAADDGEAVGVAIDLHAECFEIGGLRLGHDDVSSP